MPKDDRERFEEDYRDWIRLMSRDAACRLSALPLPEQKRILLAYEDFKDPGQVYRELSQAQRVRSLAGERIIVLHRSRDKLYHLLSICLQPPPRSA